MASSSKTVAGVPLLCTITVSAQLGQKHEGAVKGEGSPRKTK